MAEKRRKRTWAVAAAVAAVAVVSVVWSASGGKPADKPKTVRWAIGLPTSWDPVTSKIGWDIFGLNLAYEGLTEIDANGLPQPGLAKSWKYNAQGTEVTFTLRENLKFTDGTALNAKAVADYFVRSKTQKDARSAELLETITDIVAVDDLDVRFTLSQPDYQVPLLLAGRVGYVASPSAAATDQKRLEQYPVGAGPFRVVESVLDDRTVFEKNPDYWRADEIFIDRFELYPRPDPASVVSAVQTGVYNVAFALPAQAKAAEAAGLDVEYTATGQVADILINRNRAPFDNPKVVEAFRYAFDRDEFVKVLNFGVGTTTNQPFPSRYPQFDKSIADIWPYDPDKARALLAQAGYQPGELKVEFTQTGDSAPFAELVQEQLKKVGVNVGIRVVPIGKSTQLKYYDKDFAFTQDTSTGRESPVQALMVFYGPQGIMNGSAPHASKEFLDALAELRTTPLDAPNYREVLNRAVRIGVQQNPNNYLYEIPWTFIKADGVTKLAGGQGQIRWEGVKVSGK
ncbi:ABC transporter substrate-binding protein [Bordetella genomosp. 13]|uniref:ABC transporter substrate-binding protein n=1 Tax=Bordetella genomosp. 13 TaxID=463040 RepID=UPI001642832C|nr:ABC transporter substrate-binding protein [Bordetella genomosp. 13]